MSIILTEDCPVIELNSALELQRHRYHTNKFFSAPKLPAVIANNSGTNCTKGFESATVHRQHMLHSFNL